MKTTVVIQKCNSYDPKNVYEAVERCVNELGGIAEFVRPGKRVLLKPNLLVGAAPQKAIVTHPAFVRAGAILAKEAGGDVTLGDSPSLAPLGKCLTESGYDPFMRELGIKAVPFEQVRRISTGPGGLGYIEIAVPPLEADLVINLPKLKTHAQMHLTLAVKNLFGCVAGRRKTELHLKADRHYAHFGRTLVEIAKAVSPGLTIVDGVLAMEGNGPRTGKPRHLGVIIAGTDCAAIDTVICEMLSLNPDLLYTHKAAKEIGWGVTETGDIELKGVPLEDVRVRDFAPARRDVFMAMPAFARWLLRRAFTSRPEIASKLCVACGECAKVCPVKAIRLDKKAKIHYENCIRCFCCQEICPQGAISARQGAAARLLRGRK